MSFGGRFDQPPGHGHGRQSAPTSLSSFTPIQTPQITLSSPSGVNSTFVGSPSPTSYSMPSRLVTPSSLPPTYDEANVLPPQSNSFPTNGRSGLPNNYGQMKMSYEYEDSPMPTDFDALFSGKSRPSGVVSGLNGGYAPARKTGVANPNNLMYENSGFSRTVHFDITQLPEEIENAAVFDKDEYYAVKRRESIAHIPKKSKSRLVSLSKLNKNARWLEWSEKMRMENQIKKEEFLRKQEEAAKKTLPAPIKKARQESVKFVQDNFVPLDEDTPLAKAMADMSPTAKPKQEAGTGKKRKKKVDKKRAGRALNLERVQDKYTEDQWTKLHEYWAHPLFMRVRPCGFILAVLAVLSLIPPLISTRWVTYEILEYDNFTYTLAPGEDYYYDDTNYDCSTKNEDEICYLTYVRDKHYEHHGLWFNCTENLTSFSGINDPECIPLKLTGKNDTGRREYFTIWNDLYPTRMAAAFLKFGPKTIKVHHTALSECQRRKELYTYKPFRYLGCATTIAAIGFGIYALVNRNWMKAELEDISIGIWDTCYEELQRGELQNAVDIKEQCHIKYIYKMPQWQGAVIGLLLFSMTFGCIASILTGCGICSLSLSKKVYYYHSAGEIYFVCGICATAALIAYPVVMESSKDTPLHKFGIGYFLAWGMPFCFYISAFCMTLDDMIHALSNRCCLMCRNKKPNESKSNHV